MRFPAIAALLLIPIVSSVLPIYAETRSIDFAATYQIKDKNAIDGDVLDTTSDGFVRSSSVNSEHIFGILQTTPTIVYRTADGTALPISRTGIATVNVTTINGSIKPGDYVTSSKIPGKGQKATSSGYVVGVALENLPESGGKISFGGSTYSTGQIQVALGIQYFEFSQARSFSHFLDYFNTAVFQNVQNPQEFGNIIKYILAALIIIVSFIIGYLTFSRSLFKGIEAIGRNPLARRAIFLSILINVTLTLVIVAIGVGAAIFLIRL